METVLEFFENIPRLLSTIQIMDVVDILVMTYIIYRVILVIRSTSTSKIAKAILAVLAVFWLTGLLEMHMVHFLLDKILGIGILALVILFQPELRRAMERIGSQDFRALLGGRSKEGNMEQAISQTVAACEIMSREKVGALIVFERKNRLDEYFKTGTVIDGAVSEQLLRNIFFPKASLHDGAVVVRDGRVAAAGCVLPLSTNIHLSADLGTRHRAGIGISEATDAVVVIVSEETGTISVAVGGMLKRHLATQTLERLMQKELVPADEEKKQGLLGVISKVRRKERKDAEE